MSWVNGVWVDDSGGSTSGGSTSGGSPPGGIPLNIRQQVAQEGLDPFSPEGEARAYELMSSTLYQLKATYGDTVVQIGNDYWYKGSDGNAHKIVVDNVPKGGSGSRMASDDPRYWEDKDRQYQLDLQNAADKRADSASANQRAADTTAYNYASLNAENQRAADLLAARYQEMGMTADNAKRAALASVVDSQNSLAGQTANTSANVAKQVADYAANPRDAYAEAYYANQVGGVTPFGELGNKAFGDYGRTLAEKAARIFQPVTADLNAARARRDANPLKQLDIGPSAVRPAPPVSTTPAAPPDPWAAMRGYTPEQNQELIRYAEAMKPKASSDQAGSLQFLASMQDQQKAWDFRQYTTGGEWGKTHPRPVSAAHGGSFNFSDGAALDPLQLDAFRKQMPRRRSPMQLPEGVRFPWGDGAPYHPESVQPQWAKPSLPATTLPGLGFSPLGATPYRPLTFAQGGEMNFDTMFAERGKPGFSPSSSEGGTNLNIHERAVIVGESGQIYATLGEKRPDGSVRAEQLQIKPLKSEVKKDKQLEEGGKAIVESQKKTLASFATGGDVAATPDDLYSEFSKMLQRFTGEYGGGGTSTPFGGTRHVAGTLADEAMRNPQARNQLESTYSAMGISPEQLWADVARFTPTDAGRQGIPRISWG